MTVKTLFALALAVAVAVAGIGAGWTGASKSSRAPTRSNQNAAQAPASFSHPLVFPPVNTNANVSIGIDEGCVQILNGPCTNMWTYGGTYPGLTLRRPASQTLCLFQLEDRAPIPTKGLKKATTSAVRCSFTMTTVWTLQVATSGWVLLECTL